MGGCDSRRPLHHLGWTHSYERALTSPSPQLHFLSYTSALDDYLFWMPPMTVKDWHRGHQVQLNWLHLYWHFEKGALIFHLTCVGFSDGIMSTCWSRRSWIPVLFAATLVVPFVHTGSDHDRRLAGSSSCYGGFDLYFVLDKWVELCCTIVRRESICDKKFFFMQHMNSFCKRLTNTQSNMQSHWNWSILVRDSSSFVCLLWWSHLKCDQCAPCCLAMSAV